MQNPVLPDTRPASVADAKDLTHIRAQCFHETWQEKTFADMINDTKNICLIIPGTAYVLAQKIPPEAELITIAVMPEHRRRGIAQNLLSHLWQILQSDGIHALYLEVNETLTGAQNLYRKIGFESTGRRKGYYQNSRGIREDAILMRLQTPL